MNLACDAEFTRALFLGLAIGGVVGAAVSFVYVVDQTRRILELAQVLQKNDQ